MDLEARLELAALEDRQNARARDIAFIQGGHKNLRADIMVICAAIGLIVCLGSLVFMPVTYLVKQRGLSRLLQGFWSLP